MQNPPSWRPYHGNIDIDRTRFRDTWPNGRPYKHGALEVFFIFKPGSGISAEADVGDMMKEKGFIRGVDYHIPGWNYDTFTSLAFSPGRTLNKESLIITFNDDETFVMAKLGWNLGSMAHDDDD